MQAENLWIKPARKLENSHVVGVGHRGIIVFAANEIDPHHARIADASSKPKSVGASTLSFGVLRKT
jgi:hypothetical protein